LIIYRDGLVCEQGLEIETTKLESVKYACCKPRATEKSTTVEQTTQASTDAPTTVVPASPQQCSYDDFGKIDVSSLIIYRDGLVCEQDLEIETTTLENVDYACCRPRVTEKSTTVEQTTQAPTEEPTTKASGSIECLISCPRGIVAKDECKCCNFEGYDGYHDLLEQQKALTDSVKTAGESTKDIMQKIEDGNKAIKDYEDFIIQNCNSAVIDAKSVSDKLEYMRTKIVPLRINVEKFVSKLKLNTACANTEPCPPGYKKDEITCRCSCTLSCNYLVGEVNNWEFCQCENLPISSKVYTIESKIVDSIYYLYYLTLTSDSSSAQQLIQECHDFDIELNDMRDYMQLIQHQWENTTLEEKTTKIEAHVAKAEKLFSKTDAYISTSRGSCSDVCDLYSVQKYDCSCSWDGPFDLTRTFMTLETKIDEGIKNEKGDIISLGKLKTSSDELKQKIKNLIESFRQGDDQNANRQTIIAEMKKLDDDWNTFQGVPSAAPPQEAPPEAPPSVPSSDCTIICEGDNVKNRASCTCFAVDNWVKLKSEIKNSIGQLKQEVGSLNTEQENKDTLISNLESLDVEITNLVSYSENVISSIEENNVISKCKELVSLYQEIIKKIQEIKDAKSTVQCDVNCPKTGRWDFNPATCSCTCPETTCTEPSKFDPFKCDCVPTNPNCNLTKENCGSTEILDYTNCKCKPKP
jgi:hypothetical protein